jgi:isocitrate dehydrogenase (NAD+)
VAKDLMGTNRANPAAMILSATMMLRHLGFVVQTLYHKSFLLIIFNFNFWIRLDSIANSVASSTFDVINDGKVRTADMGGKNPSKYITIM